MGCVNHHHRKGQNCLEEEVLPVRSVKDAFRYFLCISRQDTGGVCVCMYHLGFDGCKFRMKEVTVLPNVGGIEVYVATRNSGRHYQLVAEMWDHRYE